MSFKEHDLVKLKKDLPAHNLPKGAKGTIVHCYPSGRLAFEVEFDPILCYFKEPKVVAVRGTELRLASKSGLSSEMQQHIQIFTETHGLPEGFLNTAKDIARARGSISLVELQILKRGFYIGVICGKQDAKKKIINKLEQVFEDRP